MATVASIFVRLGADVSNFEKNMNSASKSMQSAGKAMQGAGKALTTRVTLPIVGLGAAAVRTGMQFQTSMSRVAAVSGATGQELQALEDQARQLGETTQFSATEAAEGMEFLGRAGFETADIMGAMPGLLDLAAAGAVELGTAADITSNIMSGFGIAAENATEVADVLAKAAASANTDVQGLGSAMKFVAPVAAGLGVSMEETTAAIGTMANAGIDAGMAGRTLRSSLTRLAKPTAEAQGVMDELGLQVFDAQGNFVGLQETMARLEGVTADMTDQQRAQTLATLFGQEAMSGFTALLDAGSSELGAFTNELENSEGSAADMASTMQDNLGGSMKVLQSALEGLALDFFDLLEPSLSAIVSRATDLVRWLSSLSQSTQRIIAVVAAAAAAAGPLIWGFGTLIRTIGRLLPVIKAVGAFIGGLSAPVLAIVAVIGLMIFALSRIEGGFEKLREVGMAVWGAIQGIIESTINFLVSLWENQGQSLLQSFINIFNSIVAFLQPVTMGILNSFLVLIENLQPIWQQFLNILGNIMPLFQMIWNILEPIIAALGIVFLGFLGTAIGVFNGIIRALGPFVSAIMGAINIIVSTVGFLLAVLTGDWEQAWNYLFQIGVGIWDVLKGLFNTILGFIEGFVFGVLDFFRGLWRALVGNSIVDDIVSGMLGAFGNLLKSGTRIFRNLTSNMLSQMRGLPRKLYNRAKNAGSSLWKGFKNALGISSPSLIDEAFMNMKENAFDTTRAMTRLAPRVNRAAEEMAKPIQRPSMGSMTAASAGANGVGTGNILTPEPEVQPMDQGGITINVQNMSVRNDQDIERIANRLFKLQQAKIRAAGGRV